MKAFAMSGWTGFMALAVVCSIISLWCAAALGQIQGQTAQTAQGAELLVNGGFGGPNGWQTVLINGSPQADFAYTAGRPAAGAGACLRVSCRGDGNIAIFQPVTLEAGVTYELRGASSDIGSAVNTTWAEVFIGRSQPSAGHDYMENRLITNNTFDGGCPKWDAAFDKACRDATTLFTPPASGPYYYVIKIGCMNGGPADVLMDEVSLRAVLRGAAGGQTAGQAGGNVIVNGDFAAGAAGWHEWKQAGETKVDFQSVNAPKSSGGAPCLEIRGKKVQGADFTNGGAWQRISLEAGKEYELSGFARDVASPARAAWLEIFIGEDEPKNGQDYAKTKLIGYSTFADGCDDFDGPISQACDPRVTAYKADGQGIVTRYLLVKAGLTQVADGTEFAFAIDDLRLAPKGAGASGFGGPSTMAAAWQGVEGQAGGAQKAAAQGTAAQGALANSATPAGAEAGIQFVPYTQAGHEQFLASRGYALVYVRSADANICRKFEETILLTEAAKRLLQGRTVLFFDGKQNPEMAQRLGVIRVPALLLMRPGQPNRSFEATFGASAEDLQRFLADLPPLSK